MAMRNRSTQQQQQQQQNSVVTCLDDEVVCPSLRLWYLNVSTILMSPYMTTQILNFSTRLGAWNCRDRTGSPGHGSPILVGLGHGSVCQTRFWVLTCSLRLSWRYFYRVTKSRQPHPRFRFGSRHSTTGLLISVSACNIYLLTCWLSLWRHDVSGF